MDYGRLRRTLGRVHATLDSYRQRAILFANIPFTASPQFGLDLQFRPH